jgi:hypothetical protein
MKFSKIYQLIIAIAICIFFTYSLPLNLVSAPDNTNSHSCTCTNQKDINTFMVYYRTSELYDFLNMDSLKNKSVATIYNQLKANYILLDYGVMVGENQKVERFGVSLLSDTNYIYIFTVCPHNSDKKFKDINMFDKKYIDDFISSMTEQKENCFLMIRVPFQEYYNNLKIDELKEKSIRMQSAVNGTIFLNQFKEKQRKNQQK